MINNAMRPNSNLFIARNSQEEYRMHKACAIVLF